MQVLERLWWHLDNILTYEDIYYSALVTFIGCIKNGTTTVLDHHAGFGAIEGSLEQIARAVTETGIRASLCYEVSDRNGMEKARAGLEENISFIKKCKSGKSPLLTATIGMHASFTIGPETMEQCAAAAQELETGVHIHVAESKGDVEDSMIKYKMRPVERLNHYNLLGPKTLAAHCVHISEDEMKLLALTKTNVAHNPQSNMNNAVGCARVDQMLRHGIVLGMGTDGMTTDMLEGLKTAHLLHKHCQNNPAAGWYEPPQMQFINNPQIMSNFFPVKPGIIAPGAAADLILVEYDPPTPLTAENYYSHMVFGMSGRSVVTTVIAGNILMMEKKLTGINEKEVKIKARERADKLWKRF
jgi:putative selenium metabolism protein SsnA